MPQSDEIRTWLDTHFAAAVEAAGVPGASIAVAMGEDVVTAAAGVLSLATGVTATDDAVFQIGSITKLWTATLVMQLVDEGLVDLDVPIQTYLPEFTVGDGVAAASMTPRHLLSHTGGFEGDIFTDTGRGDDAIEKFVASIADLPQLYPPGAMFSYNNVGYVVLGRMVEVLRDAPYDQVLTERIAAPLGLTHVAPSPYEAILHRAAVGHLEPEPGALVPAPVWSLARSNAPAGSCLAMPARDLAKFATMFFRDGAAPDGTQVLAPGTAGTMAAPQVSLPGLAGMGEAWSLGFERFVSKPTLVMGHDGNTIGQAAMLRIVPEAKLAIALLTNVGSAFEVFARTAAPLLRDLAGIELPPLPVPPQDPPSIDPARMLGTYSNSAVDLRFSQDDEGTMWIDMAPKGPLAELGEQAERSELVALGPDRLIQREHTSGMHPVFVFVGDDGHGHSQYVNFGRVVPRNPAP
ncbi:MAG: beta-lactamase family protein [Bifidobacteriaceae bacterium]|jgi:CubicO group peptidase (beta-lactamase class C family)|nr:beta-lactamase family protein [Bifidobacteriaceae bacterium]